MVFRSIEGTGNAGTAAVDGCVGSSADIEFSEGVEFNVQLVSGSGSFALCFHFGGLVIRSVTGYMG
jgi:hypothetical protein